MKNIFKKNQIIITALAIMIAIAGYLNFSGRNNEDKIADVGNGEVLDYDTYAGTQSDDITDSNVMATDKNEALDEAALDITTEGETNEDTQTKEDKSKEDAKDDDSKKTADNSKKEDSKADKDKDVAAYDVSDNGEIVVNKTDKSDKADNGDKETTAPGEAVLVSTTTTPGFFDAKRLSREQLRAKNKETYLDIINNNNLTEKAKEEAVNSMIELTAISEKENVTETLLEAKGFNDAIVSIDGKSVEVIINAKSLTEQDVAKIEDIVKRKTGAKAKNIVISPVVATE